MVEPHKVLTGPRSLVVRFRSSLAGLTLATATLAFPCQVAAQQWSVGAAFAVSIPQGEFGEVVREGYGLGLQSVFRPDAWGIFGLRLDGAFVVYGSETFHVPLSPTIPRITSQLRTTNNIGMFGIGPQLGLPTGPIQPYINGFVGFGYFYTQSSLRDPGGPCCYDYGPSYWSSTNFSDTSFAYGGGGGLGIALSSNQRFLLMLDAQYRHHETTLYLREGSIQEDGFGNVTIDAFRSDVNLVLLRFGVSYTF
jgi:opacity protein-like surface antigen